MQHGRLGHAVLAYNVVDNADGTSDVYVYDSNRPFTPTEDNFGAVHQSQVVGSVIHMDPTRGAWSFVMADGSTWGGGNGGTIFVAPESTIPQDPSLPGLSTIGSALTYLVFGSANGTAQTTGPSSGVQYMPAPDSHAIPGAGGTLIARGPAISGSFVGRERGTYSAAVVKGGFAGSVSNVSTSPGVRDLVSGANDAMSFDGGATRSVTLDLAQQAPTATGTAWSATVHTRAESGHAASAGLTRSGTLAVDNSGTAATVTFTLSSTRGGIGATSFASVRVRLPGRAGLVVTPGAGLRTVQMTIRDAAGHIPLTTLRSHAPAPARLSLGRPRLAHTDVSVSVRVAGLRTGAVMGVVRRVVRGRRVILRRTAVVSAVHNGRPTVMFPLPSNLRGRIRLLANALLIAGTAGHVEAGSRATVTF